MCTCIFSEDVCTFCSCTFDTTAITCLKCKLVHYFDSYFYVIHYYLTVYLLSCFDIFLINFVKRYIFYYFSSFQRKRDPTGKPICLAGAHLAPSQYPLTSHMGSPHGNQVDPTDISNWFPYGMPT